MYPAQPAKVAPAGQPKSAGKRPRQGPVRMKPISLPVFELPEYVCVETKWVTRKYAIENGIPVQGLHEPITNGDATEAAKKLPEQRRLSEVTGMFITEVTVPRRERAIQTEKGGTKDVGVQCRRDSEEWYLPEELPKDTGSEASDSDEFLTYVSENTFIFPNGMLECAVCGDVANTLLEHQAHMTVHHGPSALCFRCGQRLDHKKLLKHHSLSCPALAPRKSSMLFKCPHLLCTSMSHSEMQLLKHLKNHSGRKCYRCLQCKRYFKTTTSLFVHRKKEQSCAKAKVVALFRRHNGLPHGRGDPRRCSVCLKRFSSDRVCLRHRRQCILGHYRRLSKVLEKEL
ncbi:zinc finger protein 569 [Drosophila mauritiana]|uniref:Zinc finger protein 569 n=1 Tax=Drosophila mauritiana TaxID=7226 RepID=A0A6P8K2X1_DROMA|nr:zinc finger protein 569 [Drosophila mauritiana]